VALSNAIDFVDKKIRARGVHPKRESSKSNKECIYRKLGATRGRAVYVRNSLVSRMDGTLTKPYTIHYEDLTTPFMWLK
jgi:hypothetical protein